jgi:hypothetical protein
VRSVISRRKKSSPPSDVARAAALLEPEEMLSHQAQHLAGASYRRRCEIEEELAEIRRLLEGLGFGNKTSS